MTRTQKVKDRALEVGIYLPLGAYSKVKDELSGISGADLKRLLDEFVDRGQERLEPVERRLRRRTTAARREASEAAAQAKKTGERAARRAGKAASETASSTKQTGRKTASRGRAAAASQAPKTTSNALRASDLPIRGYASLTVEEIMPELGGLTQTDLTKVRAYEKANQNRATIIDAIDSKTVKLPVPDYDALTVEEIGERLEGLSQPQLKTLRKYEVSARNRSTVLEKIDSKLS